MAHCRARTASKHGGHSAAAPGNGEMPDGIDTTMDPVQAAVGVPADDGVCTEPEFEQLPEGLRAVDATGEAAGHRDDHDLLVVVRLDNARPGRDAAVLDLEYRFAPWRLGIGPVIGVAATSDGGGYLRGGLGRDFSFARRWTANLSLAASAYQPGNGKRLGRGLEFRSAIDVSYRVQPDFRLGLSLAHLSNAGISESNPGVETLTVTIAFFPGAKR